MSVLSTPHLEISLTTRKLLLRIALTWSCRISLVCSFTGLQNSNANICLDRIKQDRLENRKIIFAECQRLYSQLLDSKGARPWCTHPWAHGEKSDGESLLLGRLLTKASDLNLTHVFIPKQGNVHIGSVSYLWESLAEIRAYLALGNGKASSSHVALCNTR